MLLFRAEIKEDIPEIKVTNDLAFGQENESILIEKIRESDNYIQGLSLVAAEEDIIVGHLLFSKIFIEDGKKYYNALALAPVSIRPDFQNRGIGTRLIKYGLKECKRFGYKIVIVLGYPKYYQRFGFTNAKKKGIFPPFEVPNDVFMVLELEKGATDGVKGMVMYPAYFKDKG